MSLRSPRTFDLTPNVHLMMAYGHPSSSANQATARVQKDLLRLSHVIDDLRAPPDRSAEGQVKVGCCYETIVGSASCTSPSENNICRRRSRQRADPMTFDYSQRMSDVVALPLSHRGLETRLARARLSLKMFFRSEELVTGSLC